MLTGKGWLALRLVIYMLLTLFGTVLLYAGIAFSPWGSHWLLGVARSHGVIQYSSVEGSPLDALSLTDVRINAGGTDISAKRLSLRWASDCLLHGRLCIDNLEANGLHVEVAASDSSSSMPERIATPVPVEIRQLKMDDFHLHMATGLTLDWASFSSSARFIDNDFELGATQWDSLHLDLAPGNNQAEPQAQSADSTRPSTQSRTVDYHAAERVVGSRTKPVEGMAALSNPLAAFSTSPLTSPQQLISLPEITLPINIAAPDIRVNGFQMTGSQALQLDTVSLGIKAQGSKAEIQQLKLNGPLVDLDVHGSVDLRGKYPLSLVLTSNISSSLFTHKLSQDQQVTQGKAEEATSSRTPPINKDEHLELTLGGDLTALKLGLTAEGPETVNLHGNANLLAQQLPFSLQLATPHLEWPLPGMPTKTTEGQSIARYQVDNLNLSLDGTLQGYTLNLKSNASGSQLQPIHLNVSGKGDTQSFSWSQMEVTTKDGGSLSATGDVQWSPLLALNTDLKLHQLKPQAFAPSIKGLLNGSGTIAFQQQATGRWDARIPHLDINGSLMNKPLSLKANLVANSDMQADINELVVKQGRNTLNAHGKVNQKLDIAATLDAPELGTLLPQLAGSLTGRINLAGTLKSPQGDVHMTGQGLRYGANRLGSLRLDGHSEGGLQDPSFKLMLDAQHLVAGSQKFDSLATALTGRLSAHHLSLNINGEEPGVLRNAHLVLNGGLDKNHTHYTGELTELSSSLRQEAGDIRLNAPVKFAADIQKSRLTLDPFCIDRQQGGRACLLQKMTASAQQGEARFRLEQLPVEMANAFLPKPWSLKGSGDGLLNAHWSNGGNRFSADGALNTNVVVSGQDATGRPYSVPAVSVRSTFDANQANARLHLSTQLEKAGQLQLDAQVADPLGQRQLSGQLRLQSLTLAPYQPLLTGVKSLAGQLNGNVSLAGTTQHPLLNGQIVLADVNIKGDRLPVSVDDARIALNLNGDQGTLQGYLDSAKAHWTLDGHADWPTSGTWHATMGLDGAKSPLEMQALTYGRIRIAPHINVDATPQLLAIKGNVSIPWARIEVAQLPPTAVAPSTDEVILTQEQAQQLDALRDGLKQQGNINASTSRAELEALQKVGMALDLNVHLSLGEHVRLKAYGLDTRLQGNLNVLQNQRTAGALELFGTINLLDGHYNSFGQKLQVNKGQITFNGPPSIPSLNFEAIRDPDTVEDDVTAGVRVTGTASAPKMEIFSDPSMNQTTALSYLLRGHAPDEDGGDNALASALIGLSVSQSGRTMGAIGQTFGIEDLSLDTTGSGDNSQVVVSGYINPRLKVGYGVGMFSSIAELTLRYRLIQSLYVQVVSGADQALNLLYSFSFGRTPDHPHDE